MWSATNGTVNNALNNAMTEADRMMIISIVVSMIILIVDIVVIYSIISANKHLKHIEEFCDWYYEKHKESEQIGVSAGSDGLKKL